MPGAELGLPGPHYEPMSGSVGEPAGTKLVPPTSSPSSDSSPSSSVPSVDPDLSHSGDSDSDSDSEPDDDPYVPDPPAAPAASPPVSPSPSPSPEPEQSASPEPPLDFRDFRTPPAPGQPYVTHSGRSSCPIGEWWKVNHPYHARDHRRTGCSGRSPESAAEAAVESDIAALEEANLVKSLSEAELIEYAFLTSGSEPRSYKEAMTRDDAGLWQEASQQEYDALMQHGVWELCGSQSRCLSLGLSH